MIFRKILSNYHLTSSLLITLCALGTWLQPVQAEGSRDMFPSGALGNRGNIVWQSGTTGGFRQRTLLRVFANQGEYILVGSSAVGVGQGNIEIYNPNTVTGTVANENIPATSNFSCLTQRATLGAATGFLSTRIQELAGPSSIDNTGNLTGYRPCYYQAPSTGIYYIAMYGPSGKNSTTSSNGGAASSTLLNPNITTTQATGISVWDVTVRSSDQSSVANLTGRLHTFFLSMDMGGNNRQLHSDLYPITTDGYRYKIDMRGLDPFAFRIFGNQLGNLDSDGTSPLYHDVLGLNNTIDNPEGGTKTAPPQYPIFFNQLDSAVLSYLPVYDPLTGVQTGTGFSSLPVSPIVSSINFTGSVSGNQSTVNSGGTFSFNSNITGVYEIIISRDGVNYDPTNTGNKVLRGFMSSAGSQTVIWNGKDNSGQSFPVGNYSYKVQIHAGEYHFPMSDAENNVFGGPTYELLNATNPLGNKTAFYDHRGYYTVGGALVPDRDQTDGNPTDDALCGNNPPTPPATDPVLGADSSSASFNLFGSTGGSSGVKCTGPFGDTKTLDLWVFVPNITAPESLVIVTNPKILLLKRITAINPGQPGAIQFNNFINESDTTDDTDNPNWPDSDSVNNNNNSINTYLRGETQVSDVKPGDELEYTIYFLSAGDSEANNVKICDAVPDNMTFVKDSYGTNFGMALGLNNISIPTIPNKNLSNAIGDDEGDFYPPGTNPPVVDLCKKHDPDDPNTLIPLNSSNNLSGAVLFNFSNPIPRATGSGTPPDSYGFVRFRAKVK
ncbi:MAG: hypothetical protein ACRC2S_29055 [Waterburya sp.]